MKMCDNGNGTMYPQLEKYDRVRMPDGKLYDWLCARWFDKHNAFGVLVGDDENGFPVYMFGTEIVTVEPKKRGKFVPTKDNCTCRLDVCDATEKAYCYYTGFYSTKGKPHKAWIAKSICFVDESGEVYKPIWA